MQKTKFIYADPFNEEGRLGNAVFQTPGPTSELESHCKVTATMTLVIKAGKELGLRVGDEVETWVPNPDYKPLELFKDRKYVTPISENYEYTFYEGDTPVTIKIF